ncbi:MAG TPA: hypothetical protein VND92_05495, partial [Vicinamibacterales bacterium]|nr:hypothetical protein [Vicinamibacterales bacterium]
QITRRALPIGVVLLAVCAAGGYFSPDQFFHSYLLAYIFILNIAIGCMGVAMIQNLSGGNWGILTRRLLEAGARTMPLLALFFIPILFGLKTLYPWARPEVVATDHIIQAKALYLNVPFFIGRAVAYFVIWTTLAHFLSKWSREQDRTGDPAIVRRLGKLSAGGLVIYGVTITFAVIDWFMSMQPHWFSTIFGMIFMAGEGLSAFSFVILMLSWLVKREPMKAIVTRKHLIDLGNLMLAFVILWTYTSFSQFLLIWAGNLPEEISFYLPRFHHGWQYVAIALLLFHFAVPFILLLQRSIKGQAARVGMLAGALVAARWVDMYWLIEPTLHTTLYLSWMDVAAPLALGGIWLALWARNLQGAALLPLRDPYLTTALQYGHHASH